MFPWDDVLLLVAFLANAILLVPPKKAFCAPHVALSGFLIHQFNKVKDDKFYREEVNNFNKEAFAKTEEYWEENRFENLNKDEKGIYKMLDTLYLLYYSY